MQLSVGEILSRVTTVSDMIQVFKDEDHCRRLLEAMVWPNGRICRGLMVKRASAANPPVRPSAPQPRGSQYPRESTRLAGSDHHPQRV